MPAVPEPARACSGVSVMTGSEPEANLTELSDTLSALAGVVLGDETLDAVLDLIVSLAISAIPDVHGASVSLARDGDLVTANATSETVRELDAVQYAVGSGPCVDRSAADWCSANTAPR